ncbi:MAG TPA: serine/threonine-protein kinase, partial [Gemmatimonadaceae bacterium]|nr:serine/threonine-protein kinase [Gemmatimonadaceae bacterium]
MFCPECGTWNRASAAACTRCNDPLPEVVAAPFEQPDAELSKLRRATGSRYRVIRRLGGGGMADVYFAEQALLARRVVIKVLHAHLGKDPEIAERFRREAESAAQLCHPHVCPILDYGDVDGIVYTVMPYYEGGSLADKVQKQGNVDALLVAAAAAQVASGLDYAHRHGIVHRDVKPDNVLFDEDGNAIITDFGIATARFHGRLTASGRAMGTPHYMSPEQAMGKMVDGRSDIYAAGVLLYEMLVGFPPFDGADSYSIGYKHVHED